LITVTLEGLEGNGRLQTILKSPIFAKVTQCWLTVKPLSVNLADCLDLRFLNLGGLTFLPFLSPLQDAKKLE